MSIESRKPDEEGAAQRVNLRKTTILIVDSNEFARRFIRSICRNLHFGTILTAANTTEAFDYLNKTSVQLIVCDWTLQPRSSADFVKQLRASQPHPNSTIPIIVLTSSVSPEAIVAARDSGVDDFLTRPIVMKRLLNSFVSLLCFPRPYIQAPNYIGPCRRRKKVSFDGPERRALTLARKLPAVAAVLQQGGGGKDDVDLSSESLESLEKAGEEAVAQEAENASKARLDDVNEIFELVRTLKNPESDAKDVVQRLQTKALDVAGMGKTFGFPLLTKAGDLLGTFTGSSGDPESFRVLAKLQVVEAHAIVMKMIIDSNVRDENDPLAGELFGDLVTMVSKFKE